MGAPQERRARSLRERDFLSRYRPRDYPPVAVTVDVVVLTVIDARLCVLLVRRGEPPFLGDLALPGGFVRDESLEAAAVRELAEETGLPSDRVYLAQVQAFGDPARDPRMRVVSIGFVALVRPDLAPMVRAGGDASAARWLEVASARRRKLAFDHRAILDAALEHVRERIERSAVAASLVGATFTIPELRASYALVAGRELDPGNFRRRFRRLLEDRVVEPAPGKRITSSKPASVYRFRRPAA